MSAAVKSEKPVAVTSQPLPWRERVRNKKWWLRWGLIVGVPLILLIGLPTWYVVYNQGRDKPIAMDTASLPDDYRLLTPEQIRSKLYNETGLDIKKLQNKHLTKLTFKNFTAAYKTGQAFYGLKNYKQAQAAYGAAAAKADKTTTYKFYVGYTAVADMNGDTKLSKEITAKTIDAIKADKSLQAQEKQDLLDEITQKQRLKDLAK